MRHKKCPCPIPSFQNFARVFYIGGPGSRLLNRNRLLADPNLDLGLDRVGDQRREIYYVVRRKEGRVFGETTGSPLWHGRLSFSLDFRINAKISLIVLSVMNENIKTIGLPSRIFSRFVFMREISTPEL